MKEGKFKEFGELYVGVEEFLDYCLYEGNHSDEFAEEDDDTPSIFPSMHLQSCDGTYM